MIYDLLRLQSYLIASRSPPGQAICAMSLGTHRTKYKNQYEHGWKNKWEDMLNEFEIDPRSK
jgi:hypothetical protein